MSEGEEVSECRRALCAGHEQDQSGPFWPKLCDAGHSWVENVDKALKMRNPR